MIPVSSPAVLWCKNYTYWNQWSIWSQRQLCIGSKLTSQTQCLCLMQHVLYVCSTHFPSVTPLCLCLYPSPCLIHPPLHHSTTSSTTLHRKPRPCLRTLAPSQKPQGVKLIYSCCSSLHLSWLGVNVCACVQVSKSVCVCVYVCQWGEIREREREVWGRRKSFLSVCGVKRAYVHMCVCVWQRSQYKQRDEVDNVQLGMTALLAWHC